MTKTDALSQAVTEAQRFHRDYAALQRILSGMPDVPWETPAELEHSGFGLCRDLSIWCCSRTWELAHGTVVKIVMGMYTGAEKPQGHAWVEIVAIDGEIKAWADPTLNIGPHTVAWYGDRVPWESWRWDGKEFGNVTTFEAALA